MHLSRLGCFSLLLLAVSVTITGCQSGGITTPPGDDTTTPPGDDTTTPPTPQIYKYAVFANVHEYNNIILSAQVVKLDKPVTDPSSLTPLITNKCSIETNTEPPSTPTSLGVGVYVGPSVDFMVDSAGTRRLYGSATARTDPYTSGYVYSNASFPGAPSTVTEPLPLEGLTVDIGGGTGTAGSPEQRAVPFPKTPSLLQFRRMRTSYDLSAPELLEWTNPTNDSKVFVTLEGVARRSGSSEFADVSCTTADTGSYDFSNLATLLKKLGWQTLAFTKNTHSVVLQSTDGDVVRFTSIQRHKSLP